jgi:glycosyltransferase involved in cell wall biosynthesis
VLITVPWAQRLGGAEAMLHTVLAGASERGHDLELVFTEPGPWPAELAQAGFRVWVLPTGRVRHAHRWLASVIRLARLLRAREPDLILNWAAKTQLYGAPAAVLARMSERVIWWQHAIPRRSWLDSTATLLPARAVICYSQAAARAQRSLFPARRTFVVPAGSAIPDRSAGAASLELPGGEVIVGIVGRLQPWKGQDRLLRAVGLLRERGLVVHLLIVGGDSYGLSPEYAASLPALASSLGLADNVTMTGEVPDAGPYIERMDVLVNASETEPFGIVLLEGMARAVAVVAVNGGGPPEFIADGETGLLSASGTPEALAQTLAPLVSSPKLRSSLGDAGHERFLHEFTEAAVRERFYAHLEMIVREKAND